MSCSPQLSRMMLFTFIIISMLSYCASAQLKVITGKVTDPDGNPLQSVSVSVKGASGGTTTGADGNFSLSVENNATNVLVISSVGFVTREVELGSDTQINIQLQTSQESLDAVVVVGYGTQRRKDITGSVVSVDKQRLEDLPNTNFAQALQGAVPGISINLNNAGAEGNDNSIIIRGRNSIKASNSPLIVLDGIPYNGGISDINPSDIAAIQVLKDASAAAIYGSRGSNGVILITTKKGNIGKAVISYDGFYGVQDISNLPPILSPEEFYQFKITREPNSVTQSEQDNYDAKNFPNWLDLATRQGSRSQHTVGIRGGNSSIKYYMSGTVLDVKGVAVNDKFKRLSSRINLEATITDWLTIGTNTQLSRNDRSGLGAHFNGEFGAYVFNPLTTAYNPNGSLTIYPWPEDVFFANPFSPTLAKNDDKSYKILTNNYLQVKIPFIPGLSYRLNTGIEYTTRDQKTYWGRDTKRGFDTKGNLILNNSLSTNFLVENILSYENRFGDHNIGFTGLYSYQNDEFNSNSLTAESFPNDNLTYYQANVAQLIVPGAGYTKETLISQMARINYGYKEKYLLTLTGRRDGFSGFGANNKFAIFPSVALGWNISNESFFTENKIFNNLKLRLSYGSNGNQAVGAYQTLAKLSERSYVDGSTTAPGFIPTSLGNPDLHWETTETGNIGLDFGLLNGRLQGTLDVYKAKTHDLLLDRAISSVQGVSQVTQNIGKTSNKGFEIGLNSINIQQKDFSWTTNGNLSVNRNRVEDLYGDGNSDTLNQWFIGYPINVNFGVIYDGVWQLTDDLTKSPQPNTKPGFAKIRDLNNDGKIDARDRTIIGTNEPSFIWGMGNTFKYKNFSFYVFVHGVAGTSRLNSLLSDNGVNSGVRYNTTVKNWWTPDNPTNDFYANMIGANLYGSLGAGIYESDAFVRVKDMSLSYDFSTELLDKFNLSRLKVYVNARNLFTFTEWTGLDPELGNQMNIPLQKEYLVGLNISL